MRFVCRLLDEIVSCLTNATLGCTGLMAVTENRLSNLYVDNATTVCDMKMFVGPTTSAPLAIFNAITIPTTTTTAAVDGAAVIIGGKVFRSKLQGRTIKNCSNAPDKTRQDSLVLSVSVLWRKFELRYRETLHNM